MNVLINKHTSSFEITFSPSISLEDRRRFLAALLVQSSKYIALSNTIDGTNKLLCYRSLLLLLPFLYGGFEFLGGQLVIPTGRSRPEDNRLRGHFYGLLANGEFCSLRTQRSARTYPSIQIASTGVDLYRNIRHSLVEGLSGHQDKLSLGLHNFTTLVGVYLQQLERDSLCLCSEINVVDSVGLDLDNLGSLLMDNSNPYYTHHAYRGSRIVNCLHRCYGKAFTLDVWELFGVGSCPCFQVPRLPMEAEIPEDDYESSEGEDDEGFWEL
nr:MAG: P0 protein [Chickpea chlorotic stunt virus]